MSASVHPVLGRLHDLGQHTVHVFGVDEEDRRAVRADARLAEHARAFILEPRLGRVDIGYLVAHMMLPAGRIFCKKAVDR